MNEPYFAVFVTMFLVFCTLKLIRDWLNEKADQYIARQELKSPNSVPVEAQGSCVLR